MSDLAQLVRRVRRNVHDRPERLLVQDNPSLLPADTTMSILATDVGRLPTAGIELCFDDGTDELVLTTAPGDSAANTVALARGQDGTAATEHLQNVAALKSPRFDNAQLIDALSLLIENELWPDVWIPDEATLTYQASNDYYPAPVPGIEEIVYVYQITGGRLYEIHAEFLSPALAGDQDFPDGAILIRANEVVDSTTLFCSFRVRPSLGSLTTELEHLTVLGASAHLVMTEELAHVGGKDELVRGQVQEGAKLRAGAITWERFTDARVKERIRLQHAEQLARRKLFGAGRG